MNAILRSRFPTFAPLKTHAGAQARIDRWLAGFNNWKSDILLLVAEEGDGDEPVAFLGPNHYWVARDLADHGIAVTN